PLFVLASVAFLQRRRSRGPSSDTLAPNTTVVGPTEIEGDFEARFPIPRAWKISQTQKPARLGRRAFTSDCGIFTSFAVRPAGWSVPGLASASQCAVPCSP